MADPTAGHTSTKKCLELAELQNDKPTLVSFDDVHDWIIWQFPRLKRGWLCGAVHPPSQEYGWLPAAVHPEKEQLRIHAHAATPFTSPEAAANWLATDG